MLPSFTTAASSARTECSMRVLQASIVNMYLKVLSTDTKL